VTQGTGAPAGAARIRACTDANRPLVLPGIYDGLSARLAVEAGFPVPVVSGYSVAASRLGLPDFGYLTQTEITDAARDIVAAIPGVPVIVDADTGYGNALSAARTARLLHRAGAAGMLLEDQEWPKRCGHMAGKRVVPRDEWLAKIRAVVDLRDEGLDLFLVARTDARGPEGLDEALERGRAAAALGADAVFVEAPLDHDELARIARELSDVRPVANMVEGGRTPILSTPELGEMGFRLVLWGISGILAAGHALRAGYASLAATGQGPHPAGLMTFRELTDAVGLPEHRRMDERYGEDPRSSSPSSGPWP
jgi:2-methylisocitrate lyase-like PEP mutase family enzyme